MTKETAPITSRFKNTFVRVDSYSSKRDIQKALFAMGFRWNFQDERQVNGDVPLGGYIRVDHDYYLNHGCGTPKENGFEATKVTQKEVFEAAEKVRQLKRAAKKASRKRKQLRKQGWIPNTGTFSGEIYGDVMWADGTVTSGSITSGLIWTVGDAPWNIAYYRESQPTEVVPVETMFEDIATDMGRTVVKEVVETTPEEDAAWLELAERAKEADGWINWDGGECPVPRGTLVDVRYRNQEDWSDELNVPALEGRGVGTAYWDNDGSDLDIVAYRVCKPVEPIKVYHPEGLNEPMVKALEEVVQDTNPKRQYGISSVPLNMWSPLASAYGALGLYNGSLKYGKANFANTPVEASIYIAAAMRHLSAWAAGQEFDPADGVPNLGGVLANVAILLEARAAGTLIDDRLKMDGYLKEIDALKEIVKSLNVLHADKAPKHYTLEE